MTELVRQAVDFEPEPVPVTLPEVMRTQHVLHGELAEAYQEAGGRERLVRLMKSKPKYFLEVVKIMARTTQTQEHGPQQINIQINASLGRSPLDQ